MSVKDKPPRGTVISIRQLGKHASAILAEMEHSGEPRLVTRGGVPVAWLSPARSTDTAGDARRL